MDRTELSSCCIILCLVSLIVKGLVVSEMDFIVLLLLHFFFFTPELFLSISSFIVSVVWASSVWRGTFCYFVYSLFRFSAGADGLVKKQIVEFRVSIADGIVRSHHMGSPLCLVIIFVFCLCVDLVWNWYISPLIVYRRLFWSSCVNCCVLKTTTSTTTGIRCLTPLCI